MRILTRRIRESLMIGDTVTVTVIAVKGMPVCIGIKAPDDVTVVIVKRFPSANAANAKAV